MSEERTKNQEPAVETQVTDPEAGNVIASVPQSRLGRQRGTDDSFIGRAAQLAVMAELLQLRCNVAIPEVDLGTDVFVFRDDREEVVRLQVKACTVPKTYQDGSGFSAKFSLPMKQFHRLDDRPPLYYALAVLREGKWTNFLVISRAKLQAYYNGESSFGSYGKANEDLVITLEFRDRLMCSGRDLTEYRDAWGSLPPLQPKLDLGTPNGLNKGPEPSGGEPIPA